MNRILLFCLVAQCLLSACTQKPKPEIREDFKTFYDYYGVEGSFALFDQNKKQYTLYNEPQFTQVFTPASTFKICNSLIGLETGVIENEDFVIAWDSVKRKPVWDKDHNLKTAFKNSVVWYYQDLARNVGAQQMKLWLDSLDYGNRDTSGGIDRFWLSGGLRISPEQQIDFLQRLHKYKLPVSDRNRTIVGMIMIAVDSTDYVLYGKTGWGVQEGQDIGWYVGIVETADNVYYFSNCIQAPSASLEDEQQEIRFHKARTEIVDRVLTQLKIKP